MKAVILAAGKGTRMKELTQALPKPMLKVQGKPILQHIIEGLMEAGVREFCIITGYAAEVIEKHFGDGSSFGATITYARQEVQDGTGKAPEVAKEFVGDEPFLLTYGDILVKPETYQAMLERFNSGDFDGLITVTPGQDVTQGGLNFFDEEFCLLKIVEKPSPGEVQDYVRQGLIKLGDTVWYNAGIYIFRPVLFRYTARLEKSLRGEYELTDAINLLVESGSKIAGLKIAGRWVDVRDPDVLRDLEQDS